MYTIQYYVLYPPNMYYILVGCKVTGVSHNYTYAFSHHIPP